MTITREHLELAALAAGHEIVCALDDLIGPGPAAVKAKAQRIGGAAVIAAIEAAEEGGAA